MRRSLRILLLVFAVRSYADNVVVWDFATRNGEKNTTTESLTYEFEEALSQNCTYAVLERRKLDRLQAVIENEKALQDVGQLTAAGSTELKRLGAGVIVFGEMYDDVESGEVTVTVTFQDFKGKKILIKSGSIRRGLLRDSSSRRERMTALAADICKTAKTTATPSGKMRVQKNDYIFDLEKCAISDRTVLCEFLVTNNGEDRELFIILDPDGRRVGGKFMPPKTYSLLYDEFNNVATAARAQISNAAANAPGHASVNATLISGRPAEASLRFEGLSSKATTVTRLDITCVDGESGEIFVATFRNVPLVK